MVKQKKISVAFKHIKTKNYPDLPNSIQCRIVYNRKTTTFNMRLVNGGIRCSDEDFKKYYGNSSKQFDHFENWIKKVVRYEIDKDKDVFELTGISKRIDNIHLKPIRNVIETITMNSLLKSLQEKLTFKSYMELETKNNFPKDLNDSKYEENWGFIFLEKVRFLVQDLQIPLNTLPSNVKENASFLVNFILFDYQVSLNRLNKPDDYVYGFLNIGDWLGDATYEAKFYNFLTNRKVLTPEETKYLIPFVKKEFPNTEDKADLFVSVINNLVRGLERMPML